jgi:hypothetical protein
MAEATSIYHRNPDSASNSPSLYVGGRATGAGGKKSKSLGNPNGGAQMSKRRTGRRWRTPTQQATEITLQRRIENALKDLEIFNAHAFKMDEQGTDPELEPRIENALKDLESATTRAFKADQERLNELARKAGIDR